MRARTGRMMAILAMVIAFLVIGCNHQLESTDRNQDDDSGDKNDDDDNDGCVDFTLLSGETLQPSVVKVYFQLRTCDGAPLPGIQADQFLITEDEAEISIYESDQGFAADASRFQQAGVLLLDMSGSILESGNLMPLQQAAKTFIQTVTSGQSIAIYTFDGRADIQQLVGFTTSLDELKAGIDSLDAYEVVDNSTNLNGAVLAGLDVLEARERALGASVMFAGSLITFTDGKDLAARVSDSRVASAATESPFSVYTIGLGAIDTKQLAAIGKDGSYVAQDVTALEQAFTSAAGDVESMARSYYNLAYCSPKRAGLHTLELSLRDYDGNTSYDFDANGFDGGCTPQNFANGPDVSDGDEIDGDADTAIPDGDVSEEEPADGDADTSAVE